MITPQVGDVMWFRHWRSNEPVAATVTKVINDWTVNLLVLDNGEGILTDGMGAEPKSCILLVGSWSATSPNACCPKGAL